jgi:hypothetical protein
MLLLVAADQVRHLVRRRGKSTKAGNPPALPKLADASSPLPVGAAVPAGTRYQLFRALRAMAEGQLMVVERRIPTLVDRSENASMRSEFFQRLRSPAGWQGQNDVVPLLVPGTAYPNVIGRILIRAGWCAPCERPHWVPNLRFFFLTDLGRESFVKAQAWWAELTALERMRLMLLE